MKLTVLGKYGPYPPCGGATSGYLISSGNTNVLIECGSGVLSRLQAVLPIGKIDAIILSHLHSDHLCDMFVLRYALQRMMTRGEISNAPLKVFCPDMPIREVDMLRGQNMFELITISDSMRVRMGDLEISFHNMAHPVPSYGMLIYDTNSTFAYTGDTRYHDEIIPFAMGADMLLADTGLLHRELNGGIVPHLTAREVGQIAAAAGVKRLLCTHIAPIVDEREVITEVSEYFPGAEIAAEMTSYEI